MHLPALHPARRPHRCRGTSFSSVSYQILPSGLRAPPAHPSTPAASMERRSHLGPQRTYLHNQGITECLLDERVSTCLTVRRHIESLGRLS